MHGLWRERGQTNCHVLGSVVTGRAVANPFPGTCDHRLSGGHIKCPTFVFHADNASKYDGNLVELRTLPRLFPAGSATPFERR